MAEQTVTVGVGALSIEDVIAVARGGAKVAISDESKHEMALSRAVIDHLADDTVPHYGISTGFGALASTSIPKEQRAQLQKSLIRSHAAGAGPEVEREVVRGLLVLRLSTLCTGRTGVRPETAQGIFGVRLTFSILPMIFVVFSAISIYRYSMTKKDHEMIRAAIQEKKEKGYVTLTEEQIKRCEKISGQKFEDMWIGRYDRANEEVLQ